MRGLKSKLSKLEQCVARLPAVQAAEPRPQPVTDAGVLAAELADTFENPIKQYQESFKLTEAEAAARAATPSPGRNEKVAHCPPHRVSWSDLEALARANPAGALERWEQIMQAAREELRSGHRAAKAIEGPCPTLWGRAQFLALHTELMEAWRPQNAQEQQLIDMLAQAQTRWWELHETWLTMTTAANLGLRKSVKDREPYAPPLVSDAKAVEQAAEAVKMWHGMYLRTLKELQGMRKLSRPVVVRRAGQVNVAQQQVNINEVPG